jgi:predicted alpha/beta-hydrolase family hydrolase
MEYLVDRPDEGIGTLILAHGAGAPMDSEFMNALTAELVAAGLVVVRFEFPYMAQRRVDGKKRPPNRQPILVDFFERVVREIAANSDFPRPLLIGGKSMGGRMASLVASGDGPSVAGVYCFGYPFHPPGKPENLAARTVHLQGIDTPVHIFQGTRDPFGKPGELSGAPLSPSVSLHWLEDGDHDLKPRQAAGSTQAQHLRTAAELVRGCILG